ncbi:hypothetical protein MIND_00754700 [Mycena indigotica]|uniref:F-box domain-containing protein n=1 Tax=Mycena indigotica TaxID=2126181 RepID=A0A8H6SPA0_9AGAR|nr:uncharacterized protein MIND_00754700 [Mycena indigotica]KAF7301887.1 hypothetical protein MIND_00754700 [Mycena indigotica]
MIETLPVELIGRIIGELHLADVVKVSQLSRQMRLVSSDTLLNVWRQPILRGLRIDSDQCDPTLKHLSVHSCVPRHNWIEILAIASPEFILYDSTLPNLANAEWKEAFRRRFLPSWSKGKESTWKRAFMSSLHMVWHRSRTPCTVTEAWTKYIVLNRNGSANLLEVSSRNFNPTNILDNLRHGTFVGMLQQNTYRLPLRARLVVQFADVRIIALGTLDYPRSQWAVNSNAKLLMKPPEIGIAGRRRSLSVLTHPTPAATHARYPFCESSPPSEEPGLEWVGGLMIVAQICSCPVDHEEVDEELLKGAGRQQYASFSWEDLWAVAPWLRESITRCINGQGLGN